jgi:DNA-binding NarL/FixJ family response regulator
LRQEPDVEFVGPADDSGQLVDVVKQLQPQVVLLGTDLADQTSADDVKRLIEDCPDVSVIVTSTGEVCDQAESDSQGTPSEADGESSSSDELLSVVVKVISGAYVDQPELAPNHKRERVSERIAGWHDSYLLRQRSPNRIRMKRYSVLLSSQRVCPSCYKNRVSKNGGGESGAAYKCSACGARFVGAVIAGTRIGIAER